MKGTGKKKDRAQEGGGVIGEPLPNEAARSVRWQKGGGIQKQKKKKKKNRHRRECEGETPPCEEKVV